MAMRATLLGALLVVLSASCQWGGSESPTEPRVTYVVNGHVRSYPSKVPVEGVSVGCQDQTAMTDANGNFRLQNLKPGGCDLVASKTGFVTAYQILTIIHNKAEYNVTIDIGPVASGRVSADGSR